MTTSKFNWEDVVKSFDEVEKNLQENLEELDIDAFFKDFHEKFAAENGIEKWHILEAKERIKKIQKLIDDLKNDLLAKKISLVENRKKFTKYSKASVLEDK